MFPYYTEEKDIKTWGQWDVTADPMVSIDQAPNFMYNEKLTWSDSKNGWVYSPVKYWPNGTDADNVANMPSNTATEAAPQYLSFFAYAPFVQAAELPETGRNNDAADGIIEMTANSANIDASYLYYRTSNDNPYGVDESIDLLWATTQDCYKYDATSDDNDQGRVGDRVQLNFKHALAKLSIYTQLYVDRTADLSSDAYPTELDSNTKIFIDNVTINTPSYYPEGMLVFGPNQTTPKWDYTGLSAKSKTSFRFDSDTDNDVDDVRYAIRYAAPNIPASATITDANSDGIDDVTGLTEAETVKEAFDAMETGVTASEQQLSATHEVFLFPPSEDTQAISVTAVYHVVTYDANLTLNSPKYYSNVTNNITASLGNNDFMFEPNKQYKILLSLGITSVKFDIYVLNDRGEYILLSAVVKEWDQSTTEVNVE